MSACPACDNAAALPAPQHASRELNEKFEAAIAATHKYLAVAQQAAEHGPGDGYYLTTSRQGALRARADYQAALRRIVG